MEKLYYQFIADVLKSAKRPGLYAAGVEPYHALVGEPDIALVLPHLTELASRASFGRGNKQLLMLQFVVHGNLTWPTQFSITNLQ